MLVQVAVRSGDLDTGRRALAELEETTAAFGTPSLRATERSTRGRLLLAEGDPAAPLALREAVDSWQELEVPYEEATARTLLGQALRAAGDGAGATASFEAAADLFHKIGRSSTQSMSGATANLCCPLA